MNNPFIQLVCEAISFEVAERNYEESREAAACFEDPEYTDAIEFSARLAWVEIEVALSIHGHAFAWAWTLGYLPFDGEVAA